MTLMERRRALMATHKKEPIVLYANGAVSDFAGGIDNSGYSANPTYNTVSQTASYLKYTCTSTSTASAVKGGRAFTFKNPLPASCIGRKIYVRFSHKNTSSKAQDGIRLVIDENIVDSNNLDTAYPGRYYSSYTCRQDDSFVERELSLAITNTGYVSIPVFKYGTAGGTYEFRVYEVWIE